VFRYDLERLMPVRGDDRLLAEYGWVLKRAAGSGRMRGQPFLLGPDGRPDDRVNSFFTWARMRARSSLTWRKYAHSLGLWLNFLLVLGKRWDEATEDDAAYFKEWRLTEEANPGRVDGTTFAGDLAGLRAFYRWAARTWPVVDPVAADDGFDLRPRGVREQDVKWLDPAGYRRWRDLGLRGLDREGRQDATWRGRNDLRDAAFADGLYGAGLRLTEWASVLLFELPDDDPARGYSTCRLADACAKGGYGHRYWLPRPAVLGVLDYVEGARAKAVRQAQRDGLYERVVQRRLVLARRGDRLTVAEPDGRQTEPSINAIGPAARRRLLRRTAAGLEPVVVWLNEDGLPRHPHGWHHTFEQAKNRIDRLGLRAFRCTPLSRPGARFWRCHQPVSPGRSPNPPCRLLGNGLSTVSSVRRGSGLAMGLGSCCPGRRNGRPSRLESGSIRPRPLRSATARRR
jgi:site-specific recombinase XerD